MSYRTALAILAAIVTLPTLSACSVRQDYTDSKRYAFEVRRDAPPRETTPDSRLLVVRFDISRRYESERMVYRLGDGTWESDFYNRFFVAPAEMISEEATKWFADSRMTGAILDATSIVNPTHAIEGTVTTLLGDYSGKDGPHAVLEMQLFALGRDMEGTARILVAADYEKRIPVPDRTSDALVTGWEQALREIFTDFEEKCVTAIAKEQAEAAR